MDNATKPLIFIFGWLFLFIIFIFVSVNKNEERMKNACMQDCSLSQGQYVRNMSGYKAENQCICKVKDEVKNIW